MPRRAPGRPAEPATGQPGSVGPSSRLSHDSVRDMRATILLCLCAVAVAPRAAHAAPAVVALPDGAHGIGFDDLRFDAGLGLVLAPAGGTGNLDLVDPKTGAVTAIGGFSRAAGS